MREEEPPEKHSRTGWEVRMLLLSKTNSWFHGEDKGLTLQTTRMLDRIAMLHNVGIVVSHQHIRKKIHKVLCLIIFGYRVY